MHSGGRVLIIDDESTVARALQRLLVSRGHDVEVATTDEMALQALAARTFDVVFCDMLMPRMSGPDLHAAVLLSRPDQAGRFVFMTGGADCAPPGTEIIRKPFAHNTVLDLVARFSLDPLK